MKKIIFCLFLGLIFASCNNSVPDDVNVYVVDSSAVEGEFLLLSLRDVDEPLMVPVTCCDDVFYPKGTIVQIDEELNVSRIKQDSLFNYLFWGSLFVLFAAVITYTTKKTPN